MVPWPIRSLLVAGVGFALYYTLAALSPTAWAAGVKLRGGAAHCPWSQVFSLHQDSLEFSRLREAVQPTLSVEETDEDHKIERIAHPSRSFWIRQAGDQWDGLNLLAYLLTEHEWMAAKNPRAIVRAGDIVLDCGAHVGVFTNQALKMGAEKVVAVDPDPTQVECLRRNFSLRLPPGALLSYRRAFGAVKGQ